MKEEAPRTAEYAKQPDYEAAVARANALLAGLEANHAPPRRPVLLIAGLPRSGTTLLYQVLAASGGFGYCSNLMARFYRRPALGALVQELVTPWLTSEGPNFASRAGATPGWSQPHEFGYFWEAHLPFAEHHQPEPEVFELGRLPALLGELEAVLGRPLVFKNVILTFVLARLAEALPSLRVLRIRRPRLDVALSIAKIRRAYFDDVDAWFSARPAGAEDVLGLAAPEQIAFQIARIEEALETARGALGPERWLEIDYSALCSDPRAVTRAAARFAGLEEAALDLEAIPQSFALREHGTKGPDAPADYARALAAAGLATEEPGS